LKTSYLIERIELQRKTRPKELLPYDNFLEKLMSALALFSFVENKAEDRGIKLEARKYVVVVCVSAMETYFKSVIKIFVDLGLAAGDIFNVFKEDKYSLGGLYELGKRRISIGEIISVSYSFQDLDAINRIFSKMLNVNDFIVEVAEHRVRIDEDTFGEGFALIDDYPDFREQINELIRARHLIVHHEGINRLGLKRFVRMWVSLIQFVTAADYFLGEKAKR
jgi:hypothetical protein